MSQVARQSRPDLAKDQFEPAIVWEKADEHVLGQKIKILQAGKWLSPVCELEEERSDT
jgi:hypothetical protein